ncbi:MAG: hypothetical protein JSV91_10470, partial [Phycisphaerales bacterium]
WIEYWVDPDFIGHWGVYGQMYSGTGERQWTDSGLVIAPLETIERVQARTIACDDGAMVFWATETGATDKKLEAMRLDRIGEPVWGPDPLLVSSRNASKSRLHAMRNTDGDAFLAWGDGLWEMSDIYAQNVTLDGTLGALYGDVNGDGVVDIDDVFAVLAAWGSCDDCPEDLNGDGVVDIDDLFEVLANWT